MARISETARAQLDHGVVPISLVELLQCLQSAGHEAFCVGGSVRDLIMGRVIHDWDVATSAEPAEVVALFPKVVKTGIDHGTVSVIFNSMSYEVTTYRIDVGCSDGRRPDGVQFTRSLEEDLKRRDFTMNAMAWDPISGTFVDPHFGCRDIEARVIRAVGDPLARLSEDGLRSLRGVRFASTLGFRLEPELLQALPGSLSVFRQVSVERIWQEMRKLLVGPHVEDALRILHDCGMWTTFWPVSLIESSRGLSRLPNLVELRLAHLFRHESGAFRGCGSRLKLPKKLIDQVAHLLKHYSASFDPGMSQVEVMRLRASLGLSCLPQIESLAMTDERTDRLVCVQAFLALIKQPPFAGAPISISALPIDGRWIQTKFEIKPSPMIGRLLSHCLEGVWRNPKLMNIDGCYSLIESYLEQAS